MGATVPFQATVAAYANTGFLFGSGDGNLYFQGIRRTSDWTYAGNDIVPMSNDGALAVVGRFRSRWFTFGDSASLKQVRKVRVGGIGSAATLTLRVRDRNGVIQSVVLATGKVLPFQTNLPVIDGVTGYADYTEFQFDLVGSSMVCNTLAFEYRVVRFATGPALS